VDGYRLNNDEDDSLPVRLPTLPATASAAPPAYLENRMAALSTDLAGSLRTTLGAEGVDNGDLPAKMVQIGAMGEVDSKLHPVMVDADHNLHVTARTGVPDAGNTLLGGSLAGGETWTGAWVDCEEYPYIQVAMKSPVASATDGWVLQFGADGVNVGCEFTVTYDVVGVGRSFFITRRGRYFRHKFTNGVQAANPITLMVILSKAGSIGEMMVVDKAPVAHDIALLTKSVISGKTSGGGGGYVDVKVNPSGALAVEASIAGTVPVSGPLTDTQLRATPVPVTVPDLRPGASGASRQPPVGQPRPARHLGPGPGQHRTTPGPCRGPRFADLHVLHGAPSVPAGRVRSHQHHPLGHQLRGLARPAGPDSERLS
jgi:hypothetical protein